MSDHPHKPKVQKVAQVDAPAVSSPRRQTELHNAIWLERTYYQETLKVFTRTWDLYVKFYTVFMTFNVIGLGLADKIGEGKKTPVIVAFVVQNCLTIGTSFGIAQYSAKTDDDLGKVAQHLAMSHSGVPEVVKGSPVPRRLAKWGGRANCVACLCLIVCWLAVGDFKWPWQ